MGIKQTNTNKEKESFIFSTPRDIALVKKKKKKKEEEMWRYFSFYR